MKVKELIEKLANVNPEADVILSIDSEGNAYNEVRTVSDDFNWNPIFNQIGFKTEFQGMDSQGYTEADIMRDGQDCVVLWP